jgi:redox-sensitive bicupin YhaK (pirin superfamily)
MVKPRYQDVQADEIPSVEGAGSVVRVMAGSVGDTTGPIKLRYPGTLLDVRLQPGAAWAQVRRRRRDAAGRAVGAEGGASGGRAAAPDCTAAWWQPDGKTCRRRPRCPPWLQDVPGDFTTYAYVYEGSGKLGGTAAEEQHGYVFSPGDGQVGRRLGQGASGRGARACLGGGSDAAARRCVPPQVEAAAGDAGLKFLLVAAKPFGEPIVQRERPLTFRLPAGRLCMSVCPAASLVQKQRMHGCCGTPASNGA